VSINMLVLPLWFHWALTRSVLFLMNVLAEYPERLLPRDRTRSTELINLFLDVYAKHIGHANMVLEHGTGHRTQPPNYGGSAWSPADVDMHARGGDAHDLRQSNGAAGVADPNATAQASWQPQTSAQDTIQHPATPLLDTLSQCLTWARHGGVM
jgi:hypothetical protein